MGRVSGSAPGSSSWGARQTRSPRCIPGVGIRFWVFGSRFRVRVFGFEIWDVGCRVLGIGLRVEGLEFGSSGSEFRVQGVEVMQQGRVRGVGMDTDPGRARLGR